MRGICENDFVEHKKYGRGQVLSIATSYNIHEPNKKKAIYHVKFYDKNLTRLSCGGDDLSPIEKNSEAIKPAKQALAPIIVSKKLKPSSILYKFYRYLRFLGVTKFSLADKELLKKISKNFYAGATAAWVSGHIISRFSELETYGLTECLGTQEIQNKKVRVYRVVNDA